MTNTAPNTEAARRGLGGSRPRAAFTIVELLVVIGIITVLMAILLPVLKNAREQARRAVCASNMRQIGIAALTYANDHKGILPIPIGVPPPSKPLPFEAIGVDAIGILSWDRGVLWPYISRDVAVRQRIFLCPSDDEPRMLQAGDGDGGFIPNSTRNFSYSLTDGLITTVSTHPDRFGIRLTQVRHPSNKLLILEGKGPAGADLAVSGVSPTSGDLVISLTKRHQGMCNVCCFDGHVEVIDPDIFKHAATSHGNSVATPAYEHYVDIFSSQ